jgi:uncharacterized ferritin-like protein (DUF455 family)
MLYIDAQRIVKLMINALSINFENNWNPYRIAPKQDMIRALGAPEGVADRLRVVAFAELQARDSFQWAADFFTEAPPEWRERWREFAAVENRHAQMLLDRAGELGVRLDERAVSDKLSRLCRVARDPVLFLFMISSAEERGMEAGFTIGEQMKPYDEVSAGIFRTIAEEEVEHVEMANKVLSGYNLEELKERARAANREIC